MSDAEDRLPSDDSDTGNALTMDQLNDLEQNQQDGKGEEKKSEGYNSTEKQMDWATYSEGDFSKIKVRGAKYLNSSNKKASGNNKTLASKPLFDLAHMEGFSMEEGDEPWHVSQRKNSFISKMFRRNPHLKNCNMDAKDRSCKFLVVHFYIPYDPMLKFTLYFQRNDVACPQFEPLWDKFVNGDQKYRDQRFKFIPNVVEGAWAVRKGVGNKPAILGKALKQTYHKDPDGNYLEIDVDVTSSRIANKIFRLVIGSLSNLVIEFFFLIEAQDFSELPECLIGGCRMMNVDVDDMPYE